MRGRSSGQTGPPVPGLTRVGGGANRFGSGSMSPFREIAVLTMGFNAPQPESPTRISRAKAALNGPVTDPDARPSRDGSEQFWSGTQAYAAKFEPAGVELGPNDERFRSPKTRFE